MISRNAIAVLPFVNMSSDQDNEYFSDGITEEIINALAKIEGLKVTSRTSSFFFKNKNFSVNEIGNQLNVNAILEGSVRLSGGTIRITAQLIEAEEDFHFWSETWDRRLENIFDIQDEISLEIADKIREQFGHLDIQNQLVLEQTKQIEAYTLSLKARALSNLWNPTSTKDAIALYEKAIEIDENHAESYAGLADCYGFLGTTRFIPYDEAWSKATALTKKAEQLNPNLASVLYQLGNISFFVECNYSEAYKYFSRAVSANHNHAEARQFLAYLCTLSGDFKNAKKHINIALEVNPFSQETIFFNAYYQYCIGNYNGALEILDSCIDHNPLNIPAHTVKCHCLLMLARFTEVQNYFDSIDPEIVIESDKIGLTALAIIMAKPESEQRIELEKFQSQVNEMDTRSPIPYILLAAATSSQYDIAIDWINKALKKKEALGLIHLTDPILGGLKMDTRYKNICNKVFKINQSQIQKQTKQDLLSKEDAIAWSKKLIELIEIDKPYLEPALTLRSLSDKMQIHPNQLSWLLNQKIGKSFNEFINSYRINAFKKLAQEGNSKTLSILGIAYDCGFNSKTVFNTFFKKETGLTPKEYLAQLETT